MKTKYILVTGANGQLGSDIIEVLTLAGHHVSGLTHADADLSDMEAWKDMLSSRQPDVLINTAAFHHVDQCEADPDKAHLINATGPAHLAALCKTYGIRFIHFSTDYVFDGSKGSPYIESDATAALNHYGKSKAAGENRILEANPDALIIRVSAIYGKNPCRAKNGLNFVQLMLKKASEGADLKVVDDEQVSPTSTESIANNVAELLNTPLSGIVHMTSEGSCSWFEFAEEIFRQAGVEAKLARAKSTDFPAKTPRPSYSVLENQRLKDHGVNFMPHWKIALQKYLHHIPQKHN